MVTVCQYRFMKSNKCSTLVEDFDNRRGFAYMGEGEVDGKSLYFPSILL